MTREEIANADKTHLLPSGPSSTDSYGYRAALEVAGAYVLDFQEFGDYQGTWIARVELPDAKVYYVVGYYGSCSGCDAFEAEFGYGDEDKPDYIGRLQDFGRTYLTQCYTLEQMKEIYPETKDEWDTEALGIYRWLKEQEGE